MINILFEKCERKPMIIMMALKKRKTAFMDKRIY
jgi:hypothetical protein